MKSRLNIIRKSAISIVLITTCVSLPRAIEAQPISVRDWIDSSSTRSSEFGGWCKEHSFKVESGRHIIAKALSTWFRPLAYLISPSGIVYESTRGQEDQPGMNTPYNVAAIDMIIGESGLWRLQIVTKQRDGGYCNAHVKFLELVVASDPIESLRIQLDGSIEGSDPADETHAYYDAFIFNLPVDTPLYAYLGGNDDLSLFLESPSGVKVPDIQITRSKDAHVLTCVTNESGHHRLVVRNDGSWIGGIGVNYHLNVWAGHDAERLIRGLEKSEKAEILEEEQQLLEASKREEEERRIAKRRDEELRQVRLAREEQAASRILQAKQTLEEAAGIYRALVSRVREAGAQVPTSLQEQYLNAEAKYFASALQFINMKAPHITDMIESLSEKIDKPYVSVGWARDYPDRILLTVVWPSLQRAHQVVFTPGAESASAYIPKELNAAFLPESVKIWNATTNERGFILIKGFEQESTPPPN